MKLEAKLKRAKKIKNKNRRMKKLLMICYKATPYSAVWQEAVEEAGRLFRESVFEEAI